MNRGQSWSVIYIAVIIAIAVVLLLAIIKPMFQSAGQYASTAALLL
ncbi:MAG: hypothetical protein V1911_00070 [Candidatus Micrarchaeota archaeon]